MEWASFFLVDTYIEKSTAINQHFFHKQNLVEMKVVYSREHFGKHFLLLDILKKWMSFWKHIFWRLQTWMIISQIPRSLAKNLD